MEGHVRKPLVSTKFLATLADMNKQQDNLYYQAYLTRDAKFDGKFFVAVKTTGIYCRPICPAQPKRENVVFFETSLQAEHAGFRPCQRCHPQSAPEPHLWLGSAALLQKALLALNDSNNTDSSEDEFAQQFSVSARHLRRLFQQEIGKTPGQIKRDKRLNLAHQLIRETPLPFIEIAQHANFNSQRQFNAAMKNRFGQTPTQIRRKRQTSNSDSMLHLKLPYRPPLDWQACLNYYQKHAVGKLECFDNNSYRRIFEHEGRLGEVCIYPDPAKPILHIVADSKLSSIAYVIQRTKLMFDLSHDPLALQTAFDKRNKLRKLIKEAQGTRLVSAWDPFEVAISAILGQLISIKQATRLTTHLMEVYGKKLKHPRTQALLSFFPKARVLACASLHELKVPQNKKIAIRELSKAVMNKKIHFSSYQDPEQFKKNLLTIHGIGPWTAQYIALRAIADPNAVPINDAFLKKFISMEELSPLSPWRGYLVSYLYTKGK